MAILFTLATAASLTLAQTVPPPPSAPATPTALDKAKKDEIVVALSEIIEKRAYVVGVDLKKWPEILAKHREAIDKAESESAFVREVNGAIREFGISHLRFRTPRAAESRRQGPVAIGIGVQVEEDPAGGVRVTTVLPNSPAAAAGILVGDRIVELDGRGPATAAALTGDEGTKVVLKLARAGGETTEIEVQRQRFSPVVPDKLIWVDAESAVVKVRSFSRGYDRPKIEAMLAEAQKAKHLVLDLRSNGGGLLNNLLHLLSQILEPDTPIGTNLSRRTVDGFVEATKKAPSDHVEIANWATRKLRTSRGKSGPFTGKIAVLTNRGTGSASEMVAAALRELRAAPLVGSRSAGAVLSSTYGRLPHGFEIQYPVADYVTIKGLRLEGNPLAPDVEVAASEGPDAAIEKAIRALKAQPGQRQAA